MGGHKNYIANLTKFYSNIKSIIQRACIKIIPFEVQYLVDTFWRSESSNTFNFPYYTDYMEYGQKPWLHKYILSFVGHI